MNSSLMTMRNDRIVGLSVSSGILLFLSLFFSSSFASFFSFFFLGGGEGEEEASFALDSYRKNGLLEEMKILGCSVYLFWPPICTYSNA